MVNFKPITKDAQTLEEITPYVRTWLNCEHKFIVMDESLPHLLYCEHECGAVYNIDYKVIFKKPGKDNNAT